MIDKDLVSVKDSGSGYYDPSSSPLSSVASVASGQEDVNSGEEGSSWLADILKFFASDTSAANPIGNLVKDQNTSALIKAVNSGEMSAQDAFAAITSDKEKYRVNGEAYEFLINMLSNQRTQEAYDRDIQAIIDKANATQQAAIQTGLNPSAYMMGNGFGQGSGVDAAKVQSSNPIAQRAMNQFNQKAQTARTILGLLGGMASAGIYGGSVYAGKKAVADLTTAATRDAASIRMMGQIEAAKARRMQFKTREDRYGRQFYETYYY